MPSFPPRPSDRVGWRPVAGLLLRCERHSARVAPQMFGEEKAADVVAYEMAPLAGAALPDKGLAVAIVAAAFQAAAKDVAIDVLPAKPLAKYSLLNSEAAAMVGELRDLSEQEKATVTPEAFYVSTGAWYYYQPAYGNGLSWSGNPAELKDLSLGTLPDEDMEPYNKAGIRAAQGDLRTLLEGLRSKKIDLAGLPDLAGQYWVKSNYPEEADKLVRLTPPAWEKPWYVLFSKKHPRAGELRAAFVKGMSLIVKNGDYLALLEKYGGKQSSPADALDRLKRYRPAAK